MYKYSFMPCNTPLNNVKIMNKQINIMFQMEATKLQKIKIQKKKKKKEKT